MTDKHTNHDENSASFSDVSIMSVKCRRPVSSIAGTNVQ